MTTPSQPNRAWKEEMMDDFCVMFERATREVEPIDWAERMEDFVEREITQALAEQRSRMEDELADIIDETSLEARIGFFQKPSEYQKQLVKNLKEKGYFEKIASINQGTA